ncbi:His Kinase A (phospho-acceptor) domain-containing protein [Bradyrhizobium lablabi]|uniref:histidine kinase n=2 Tax=Bradyrhizobium lablabi TaxID=722472 RepID=A0A1M6T4C4_9BRAD|nr:His Kinase A (phospho-acceptor) domain-containing protein [Bradyrhizobium lablabi]
MRSRILFSAIVLLLAMTGEALSESKRVLLLHSFGRDFAPWSEYARAFREELVRQSPNAIDLYEASLATARFADDQEGPFVGYLSALFSERRLDLVVAIGGPAVNFVQQHRQQLFPSVPALYTAFENRRVSLSGLTANDAVVAVNNDFPVIIENMLRVLPQTTGVAVVLGDSPLEKYWMEQLRTDLRRFEGRVSFTWLNDLSLEEMLQRATALPQRSAIFFGLFSVDGAGVPHEEGILTRLHAVANAPIFTHSDAFFGQGIIGGPLISVSSVSREAASVAMRIMGGEAPGDIKTPPIGYATPKYDWRELQRWNISEGSLPAGSEIHFRQPGLWEQYRPQVTIGVAALLLQAAIISWLLVERRRRHFAQAEATSRRREVVRLNRVTTANVLSSSIAHELNQPLGAILSNTEAAQVLLKADPPDLGQISEILSDIVRDEQRASEIIAGLRNLLNDRKEGDLRAVDLNDTVRDVVKIVSPEIERRGVLLRTVLAPQALPVRSDPIHLQQVMINLVMNGIDAMDGEPGPHNLTVRTRQNAEADGVEVRISDSGKGIPNDKMASIFDAFVTTKPQGTGLGLPIARTILESYGGDISVENRQRGAVFSFRLPLAKTKVG